MKREDIIAVIFCFFWIGGLYGWVRHSQPECDSSSCVNAAPRQSGKTVL